jgi:hypothetical protein
MNDLDRKFALGFALDLNTALSTAAPFGNLLDTVTDWDRNEVYIV